MFKQYIQMTCPLMTNKNGNHEIEIMFGNYSPGWKLCRMNLIQDIKGNLSHLSHGLGKKMIMNNIK